MIKRWLRLRARIGRRIDNLRRPLTLRRILIEMAALILLHFVLVQILARVRLLDHLLSPGPGATLALAATAFFLLLRIFLLVFGAGWFVARLWLWLSHPLSGVKPRRMMPLREFIPTPKPRYDPKADSSSP